MTLTAEMEATLVDLNAGGWATFTAFAFKYGST
jgi:hypothetical protein